MRFHQLSNKPISQGSNCQMKCIKIRFFFSWISTCSENFD